MLFVLAANATDDGCADTSIDQMALDTGFSEREIKFALPDLKNYGISMSRTDDDGMFVVRFPSPYKRIPVADDVKEFILEQDEVCLRCGTKTDLTIDHIKPVRLGGASTIDNLQVLCRSCNSTKGTSFQGYDNKGRALLN
jgi:hypothetical protein